jgi:hypothetical protein
MVMKRIGRSLLLPLLLGGCIDGTTSPELDKRVFSLLGGLEVGEVLELRGAGAKDLPLAGGGEYLVVPFYALPSEGLGRLTIEFTGRNVQGPAATSRAPSVPGFPQGAAVLPPRDLSFHDRIRASERSLLRLAPAARGYRARLDLRAASAAVEVPAEGDVVRLNVNSGSACLAPVYREARVMAVSERAIVVADAQNPAGGFTPEEFRAVALAFDTLVWKVDTRNFGEPSDIDRNGRVTILYTSTVNALTPPGMPGGYVAGYFWARDLLPSLAEGAMDGCQGSNLGEMFYMLAPDPQGTINGNVFTKEMVRQSTVAVTAHEFEHLINASRRLYVNGAEEAEENWLDEGLAHIAEEQVFYESSGLRPGMNLDLAQLQATRRTADAANLFMLDNILRYWTYVENPSRETPLGLDTQLETRGAIWSFLRYAADAQPGSDEELFRALVNTTSTGMGNLARVLDTDPIDLMQRWSASVYLDDAAPAGTDSRYRQASWNMRSLLAVFPLKTLRLGSQGTALVQLKGGGSAFLTVETAAGHQSMIRTRGAASTPPDALRISVVRLK